jgi:glycosyltransferase involved in cell wall biosynthesis
VAGFPEICVLHPCYVPSEYAQSIQTLNTSRALAEAGASVCLMVRHRQGLGKNEALAAYGIQAHPRLRLRWLPRGRKTASFTTRWHVCWSHGRCVFYARHLGLALAAARARKRPVIVELHGLERATECAVRLADGIVTITSPLRERIRELYAPVAPIEVIPDGFNASIFVPVKGSGPPRLVYTGQFSEWKGVDVLRYESYRGYRRS